MPQFVIEREVPGAGSLSEDELRDLSLRSLDVIDGLGSNVKWLHSYVTDNKVYCVYIAPDEAYIHQHAERLGVPANRVSKVRQMLNPSAGHDLVQAPVER